MKNVWEVRRGNRVGEVVLKRGLRLTGHRRMFGPIMGVAIRATDLAPQHNPACRVELQMIHVGELLLRVLYRYAILKRSGTSRREDCRKGRK